MSAYDSADARTAFMVTYFSRFTYPQAGTRYISPSSPSAPLRHYDINAPDRRTRRTGRKGTLPTPTPSDDGIRFTTQGRTIYNADTDPISVTSIVTRPSNNACIPQGQSPYDMKMAEQNTGFPALAELQRIDTEEEWRKKQRYQFLMAARSDMRWEDCNAAGNHSSEGGGQSSTWGMRRGRDGSRDSTPSLSLSWSDSEWESVCTPCEWDADLGAQEIFDLYIKAEECERPIRTN